MTTTIALYADEDNNITATVMFQGNTVMMVSGCYPLPFVAGMKLDLSGWNHFKKQFHLEQRTILHLSDNPTNEEISRALDMADKKLRPKNDPISKAKNHKDDPSKWKQY